MTIAQTLKLANAKLSAKNINNPPLEAEILLSSVLKKSREFSLTHGEKQLSKRQLAKFRRLLKRRLKGEPVAYLTGRKEFFGLNFIVNRSVLIPRPETELMVEEALKLATRSSQPITLIDVGTGSGCIMIALAKLLDQESRIMNHELWGIDISPKALAVARKNAELHSVEKKIKFVRGNLLSSLTHNSLFTCPPKLQRRGVTHNSLIIIANLPYGWKAWKNNSSQNAVGLKFEPEIALFTGKKGLELYEKLFEQINELWPAFLPRLPAGKPDRPASCGLRDIHVLCEFDPRQTKLMKNLIKRELPQAESKIKKDLSGLNRLAIITMPAQRARRRLNPPCLLSRRINSGSTGFGV